MSIPTRYRRGTPSQFVCPSCKQWFPIDDILFRQSASSPPLKGRRTLLDRILRRPPRPPTQNGVIWDLVCPGQSCNHRTLPYTAASEQSLIIGLVGAQASGKSHFATTLIDRLAEDAGRRFQAGLLPADEHTRAEAALNRRRLMRDHLKLPGDKPNVVKPPLVYNLNFSGSLWNETEPRSITLALYDTAGENLGSIDQIRQFCDYLRISAGVIFIVDPEQSPAIRDALANRKNLAAINPGNTPQTMIARVIQVMKQQDLMRKGKRFRTPIAFTMTKCDVLLEEDIIHKHSRWASSDCHEGCFNTNLHEDVAATMQELFRKSEPATYQNIDNHFRHYSFFGVSATGSEADPNTGRYPRVAPWRVEEPLLWLLAKLGVIPEANVGSMKS